MTASGSACAPPIAYDMPSASSLSGVHCYSINPQAIVPIDASETLILCVRLKNGMSCVISRCHVMRGLHKAMGFLFVHG